MVPLRGTEGAAVRAALQAASELLGPRSQVTVVVVVDLRGECHPLVGGRGVVAEVLLHLALAAVGVEGYAGAPPARTALTMGASGPLLVKTCGGGLVEMSNVGSELSRAL